jgi:hypothetical protein
MSTRTRRIHCFERSWRNGQMDRAVDGDEEVHPLDLSFATGHIGRLV